MASKQPVPSRAALNALRGVILTTSCSVILLAEERRRRLQIARAAIENARKLHTVQSNRGPLALVDSHGSWEGRFTEIDDDVLSMAGLPRPRTSTRRRGRSHLIGTKKENESHDQDAGRTRSISRANTSNAKAKSSRDTDLLAAGLEMVKLENLKLSSVKPQNYQHLQWKAPRLFAQSDASNGSPPVDKSAQNTKTTTAHPSAGATETDEFELIVDDAEVHVDSIESARLYLEKSSQAGLAVRPYYDDAVLALERLLKDLETSDIDKVTSFEKLTLAATIFERVAAFGPPLPKAAKSLRSQGIRLLQVSSTTSPDKLTTILAALIPLNKDPLKFLLPFFACAQKGGNRKAVQDGLTFLSQNTRISSWGRGMLICRLLARHAKCHANFDQTQRVYRMLQEGGLFGEVQVPQGTEYKIRRLIAILALQHGSDNFADKELGLLNKLDAEACRSDIRMQACVITRKAAIGKWTEVLSDIQALGQISNIQCVEFQRLLTRATDLFAQTHSADELEVFLQNFATEYRLTLKHRWTYAVLDHYASRRQVESVVSWLQFCGNTGLQLDSACNQKFIARCRKYWSFSDKTIQTLEASLRNGKSVKQGAKATGQRAPQANIDELARQMKLLASNQQWERVAEVYETAGAGVTDDQIECLRLAVLAHIKSSNQDMQRASNLIQSAYEKGQDVSEALTPLLLAKLECGHDPSSLINEALGMGVRVHDSAYNKAAQALSASGNPRAAANMCEIAARENGNGELLYNEYNFANLVFAYTGSASYKALESLLSGFTSDMQWWHGSRTCKETIKLAMKTTAMRTVAHSQDSGPHRQALDRLDDALIHVKKCRYTKDDRRAVSEAYVRLAAAPATKAHSKTNRGYKNKASKPRQEMQAHVEQAVFATAAGSG